jgi:AcrR family transcriptional regulator
MKGMSRASAARRQPYHHGDLAAALVAAAEETLAERGVEGFSLREAARRAGVSHAAPAHHFGDARGLLTAVAAEGFARLTNFERAAAAAAKTPIDRLIAIGLSYIKFALTHPALFRLMFHSSDIDRGSELIRGPGRASFDVMQDALATARGRESAGLIPPEAARDPLVLRQWAVVHGLATLAVEGRLGPPGPGQKRFLAAARAALESSVGKLGR